MLMGKNTMIRKIITNYLKENPGHPYEKLLPNIRGNVGFIFTNGDMQEIRDVVEANRVPAPARVGAIAPVEVFVPPGPTGCDPGQTSFFQVLQIPTKIQKGQIEIVSQVHLIKTGNKVGNSEAVLLQKLNINPFTYGLVINCIYDNGDLFDAAVLDVTDETLRDMFLGAVRRVAAVSLAVGYPTMASFPHTINNAFKMLLSVAVECDDYTFDKAEPFKAYLKDPSAFASATAPAGGGGDAPAAAQEEEEEEEEVDMGGGMDMFGGGDADY